MPLHYKKIPFAYPHLVEVSEFKSLFCFGCSHNLCAFENSDFGFSKVIQEFLNVLSLNLSERVVLHAAGFSVKSIVAVRS